MGEGAEALPRAQSRLELLSNTASVIEKTDDGPKSPGVSLDKALSSVSLDKMATRSPRRTHSFDDTVAFFTDNGSFGFHQSPTPNTMLSKAASDAAVFSQLHNFSLPSFPSSGAAASNTQPGTTHHQQAFMPPRTKLQPKQPSVVSASGSSNSGLASCSSQDKLPVAGAITSGGSFFPSWSGLASAVPPPAAAGARLEDSSSPVGLPMEDLQKENSELRQALASKDATILCLKQRIAELEQAQLQAGLPTRKISQIPIS